MYRSIAIAIARYICTAVLNLLNFITIDWYNNCRYYFNYYATNNSDTIYDINSINIVFYNIIIILIIILLLLSLFSYIVFKKRTILLITAL